MVTPPRPNKTDPQIGDEWRSTFSPYRSKMEILCRVICSNGSIDLPFHQISDYCSFDVFYKNGTTQVTQEITDEAMTYRIPHLHLDCTVEMLQYLFSTHKITFTVAQQDLLKDETGRRLTGNELLKASAEVVVAKHPNLSAVDVLYYNNMYKMAGPIDVYQSVIVDIIVDLIKAKMPTINPYHLVDCCFEIPHIHGLEDFIEYDLRRFQRGTLNPDLFDDLAEMIVPYLHTILHDSHAYKSKSLKAVDYFLSKYTGPVQSGLLRCRVECTKGHCKCKMESNMKKYDIDKFRDCPSVFIILEECYRFYY